MTGYELHDLLANARELISDTWNFFLTVHLAVLGIVFIASRGIGFVERTVLVGAYLAFMYMNYAAQLDNSNHRADRIIAGDRRRGGNRQSPGDDGSRLDH